MSKNLKRLFALIMVLTMVVGLLPTFAMAQPIYGGEIDKPVYVYTDEDNAAIENDVFTAIETVKGDAAQKKGGIEKLTEQDYINLIPQVIKKIESSDTYQPGTLQQNGNFLVWQTKIGMPCCYDPRMEAELHNNADAHCTSSHRLDSLLCSSPDSPDHSSARSTGRAHTHSLGPTISH